MQKIENVNLNDKKMPINARQKGHAFERWFCELLRVFGYNAVTSRSESRRLDDAGVDIVDNTKFYFQLKAVERLSPGYHEILAKMPTEKIPVIIHKRNNKGSVAVMKLTDFQDLLLYKQDIEQ